MFDLNDNSWIIGSYIQKKPIICFGENQETDDIFLVKDVDSETLICDTIASHGFIFQKDVKIPISNVIVI